MSFLNLLIELLFSKKALFLNFQYNLREIYINGHLAVSRGWPFHTRISLYFCWVSRALVLLNIYHTCLAERIYSEPKARFIMVLRLQWTDWGQDEGELNFTCKSLARILRGYHSCYFANSSLRGKVNGKLKFF